jgi:hypothetical protein
MENSVKTFEQTKSIYFSYLKKVYEHTMQFNNRDDKFESEKWWNEGLDMNQRLNEQFNNLKHQFEQLSEENKLQECINLSVKMTLEKGLTAQNHYNIMLLNEIFLFLNALQKKVKSSNY